MEKAWETYRAALITWDSQLQPPTRPGRPCVRPDRQQGLEQVRFPPDSGDLNPIETVWAWLRRDLAEREQEDLAEGRVLTAATFRKRVAHLLNSYGVPGEGESYSSLQKLVRGMPGRLAMCRKNKFGRCGK